MDNSGKEKRKKIKDYFLKLYNNQKVESKSRKYMIAKTLLDYLLITVGCLIISIGVALILLPNELSTGGFTGIASIFYYFFNLQVGLVIMILNIPLLILGYFKIGKKFLAKNIYGILMLSIFIDIFEVLNPITNDKVLACIYGGILSGIGTALVLKGNGSTGGSDMISYLIKVYKPHIRTSKAILIFDFTVIVINVLFFRRIEIGLYSAIAIYIMGKMIDIVFEGTDFAKALFIISSKYEEIALEIGNELKRGSTGISAKGMYTNDEKMMLLCVGSRNETYEMQNIAKRIDKGAFIIIINAREVIGKGFK